MTRARLVVGLGFQLLVWVALTSGLPASVRSEKGSKQDGDRKYSQSELEELRCAGCRILVTELAAVLNETKSKETLDTILGNQAGKTLYKTTQYAYSSIHVYDSIEQLCPRLRDYTVVQHPERALRVEKDKLASALGEGQGARLDREYGKVFEDRCHEVVGEHEELIEAHVRKHQGVAKLRSALCVRAANLCRPKWANANSNAKANAANANANAAAKKQQKPKDKDEDPTTTNTEQQQKEGDAAGAGEL
eukprot:TRINITY_DN3285_c1_g1_i1.p1 TRINITY_DN3285_c1_g1~~TRINITY_DN3285_c1_g1_i1.p1  ORF type:complete len:266 (+),score=56.77 TRINITY_DN3285_c1_g1_i1:54-800(+)